MSNMVKTKKGAVVQAAIDASPRVVAKLPHIPGSRENNYESIIGERIGRIVLLDVIRESRNPTMFLVRCDCGVECQKMASHVNRGGCISCGCFKAENMGNIKRTHGHTPLNNASRTYRSWQAMYTRCYRPDGVSYKYYGARGVKVCDRWIGDGGFDRFLSDMGQRPAGMSLDRVDPFKDYSPDNCRWADAYTQASNKRCSKNIEFNGMVMSGYAWDRRNGWPLETVGKRIRSGWSVDRAITQPLKNINKSK